ncbi:hypothetical protein [Corynebacterium macginleyi]|uniref:hypothetical protein n=1 Tax=Corynebacterium macginleyi TaxID=38290 RepID=UPI00190C428D|nr:hypothetical protein [Corynebacterium macginleyi]MBM0261366.1 hypothetical protein [Corynebacterium macginleyi]
MIDNHAQQQLEPRLGRSSLPRPEEVIARYLSLPRSLGIPITTCKPELGKAAHRSTSARWELFEAGPRGIGKQQQRSEATP